MATFFRLRQATTYSKSRLLSCWRKRHSNVSPPLKARGWGDKTGALLVRSIALIARERPLARALWPDLRVAALRATRIRLPVDRVIIAIFGALKENHPQEFETVRLATPGDPDHRDHVQQTFASVTVPTSIPGLDA